jgi:hypothetical protein
LIWIYNKTLRISQCFNFRWICCTKCHIRVIFNINYSRTFIVIYSFTSNKWWLYLSKWKWILS